MLLIHTLFDMFDNKTDNNMTVSAYIIEREIRGQVTFTMAAPVL